MRTAPYFVEQHPVWGAKVTARLAALRSSGDEIAVSDLARTECLAKPLATGDVTVVADYQAFFADPDIRVLPLTASVCERAAGIRAASGLKLKVPDCLHLAAAVEHGCGLFYYVAQRGHNAQKRISCAASLPFTAH